MAKQLTDLELLAVFQALYNKIGRECATKGDGLRAQVDEHFRELYEQTGAKSFDVLLDGEKVGTYSSRFSKPTHDELKHEYKVTDYIKLAKALDSMNESYDVDLIKKYAEQNLEEFGRWYFEQTGECLPGSEFVEYVEPGIPSQYIGGTLKVDDSKVSQICERGLFPGIAGLLGGAE